VTVVPPSDALWGVGSYHDQHARVPWPVSAAEMQRDLAAGVRLMGELGLREGSRVLICSMLSEAAQHWPLIVGAMAAGAQLSCADSTGGEAARVAMFLRLLDYDAVLGLTPALVDSLATFFADPAESLSSVRVVGAHPGAFERLQSTGLMPHHFVLCGPALAISHHPGEPARVDDREWELTEARGRVLVTNRAPRAVDFRRMPTGVRGAVVDGGVVPWLE
jgi:hypothetical protein